MASRRPIMDARAAHFLAAGLAPRVAVFAPTAVVFPGHGGAVAGRSLASALGVPAVMLDVRYPLTRVLASLPPVPRALLWPFKEIAYRLTGPALRDPPPGLAPGSRVALVDDSASSGRTLRLALEILSDLGISRDRVCVAVLRCGPRARALVDVHALEHPVIFRR
jgi:hypoxanthine phosphoribosyltransferase